MRVIRRPGHLIVGAILVLLGEPASAQETAPPVRKLAPAERRDAERYFRAGEQAYNAGRYQLAAEAFERAYALLPVPAIAFSTAQAYRLQYFIDKDPRGLKRAVELYRNYVGQVGQGGRRDDAVTSMAELEPILLRIEATAPGPMASRPAASTTRLMVSTQVPSALVEIDGAGRGEAPLIREVTPGSHRVKVWAKGYLPAEQTAVAVEGQFIVVEVPLRARPSLVELRTEAGAQITVDGRAVATAPLHGPLALPAGRHFIAVTRRGRQTWGRELSLTRGQKVVLQAPLQPTAQRRVSRWVLGGAAVLVAGAGVAALGAAVSDADAAELRDRRSSAGLTAAELRDYEESRDARNQRRQLALGLLGAGTAVAVTGALLYFLDQPRAELPVAPGAPLSGAGRPAQRRFRVGLAPGGGAGAAAWAAVRF